MIIIWRMTDGSLIARALSDRARGGRGSWSDHLLMGKVREGEDIPRAPLSAFYLSPRKPIFALIRPLHMDGGRQVPIW